MRRGGNAFLFTAALASAGCVTDTGKLDIKPLADPYTKAAKAGSPAIAEGRGFLAVGSIGLAIEAFRKALRDQPDSIEALAGLAECYDQMGRHDLSRAKYEAALAIAPNSIVLLRSFAASLERQGRYAEATAIRQEAADTEKSEAAALVRMATAAPVLALAPVKIVPVQKSPAVPPLQVAAVQPKAVSVPKTAAVQPKPTPAPATTTLVAPKPIPAPMRVAEPEVPSAPIRIADAQVSVAPQSLVSKTEWRIEAPVVAPLPQASASVSVKLPAATAAPMERPKNAGPVPIKVATAATEAPKPAPLSQIEAPKVELAAGPSVTVKLPPARPTPVLPEQKRVAPPATIAVAEAIRPSERRVAAPATAALTEAVLPKAGPRLERLSLGEVALVTDRRPRSLPAPVRYTAIATAPRFVPLADLQRNGTLRLLNAARSDRLAARTRVVLNRQGWTRVSIGDAARVREKSLILYSSATEQAARRLAARYGFWVAREARPGPLTILLGRDWASRQKRG